MASAVAAAVAAAAAANTMTGKEFEDEYDPARPNDYSVYLVDKKKKVPNYPFIIYLTCSMN